MYWMNLDSKKIAVWGMGREGSSVWKALEKHAPKAKLVEISEENTVQISECDVLIKSPGVSLYREEIQKALQKSKAFVIFFVRSKNYSSHG